MRVWPIEQCAWPPDRLGEALAALVEQSGFGSKLEAAHTGRPLGDTDPNAWIHWRAETLRCEAHQVHTNLRDAAREIARACPALVRIPNGFYVAVLRVGGNRARALAPDLTVRKIRLEELVQVVRAPAIAELEAPLSALFAGTQIQRKRTERVMEMLLADQLALRRFADCWSLQPNPGEPAREWLHRNSAYRIGAGLVSTHTFQYVLWLASWAILGTLSFEGHMDRGWLLAWALLLMTLVPFRVSTTWLQGLLAIRVGAALKRRLLLGALRLQPDEMRHQGIGTFLGQVLEAEAVESLALTGGIGGLLAVIELVISGFVLGRLALLLAGWSAITVFAAWRFVVRYRNWTDTRMHMTRDLVERMVGHRTRLAQEPRADWHASEDDMLTTYLGASQHVDNTGTWLVTAITRGWLLAGLACLAPSIIANKTAPASVAIALGGILLAQTGFKRLTASFLDVTGAWISWKRIAFLFRSATRESNPGSSPMAETPAPTGSVVEAERLWFRYRPEGRAAVQGVSMAIRRGDRILLEGPSGGGKTTFASLLSGLREPNAGLLLVNGLDRQTLGNTGWRKAIAAAPQFHENHILTETLAFNLLMGRRWPPLQSDMAEAEALCRELGLGDLLDRMPGGMLQMVGEGGWQLSHGERSRVYIARALLQRADLVILDESFAALDPENLQSALECTLKHAKSLMVIAHP
jgi:ATP-binding cassette subfamily B protein